MFFLWTQPTVDLWACCVSFMSGDVFVVGYRLCVNPLPWKLSSSPRLLPQAGTLWNPNVKEKSKRSRDRVQTTSAGVSSEREPSDRSREWCWGISSTLLQNEPVTLSVCDFLLVGALAVFSLCCGFVFWFLFVFVWFVVFHGRIMILGLQSTVSSHQVLLLSDIRCVLTSLCCVLLVLYCPWSMQMETSDL